VQAKLLNNVIIKGIRKIWRWILNFVNGFAPIEKAMSQQFEAPDIGNIIKLPAVILQKGTHIIFW